MTGRRQFVNYQGVASQLRDITCGVPQGSILGPLLYLLYVNDIQYACDAKILSFADDTTLYVSNSDIDTLFETANSNLNRLYEWFCANRLSLNSSKTKYIIIKPQRIVSDYTGKSLSIGNTLLTRVGRDCTERSTKFLGIYLDDCLSWKDHIAHLNSRLSRSIFKIKQLKNFLPRSCLTSLYYALVHSQLNYGNLAWGNANDTILNKTVKLQKRAIRTINLALYNSHTDPLFRESKIIKLKDMYLLNVLVFMHEYKLNELPDSFGSSFTANNQIQLAHRTRQSHLLYVERCHSQFAKCLPLFFFPTLWNDWYDTVHHLLTVSSLKRFLKNRFIASYRSVVNCTNVGCRQCMLNT